MVASLPKGSSLTCKSNMLFPMYPATSGSHVSQRRVHRIQGIAIELVRSKQALIEKAFRTFATKRYNRPVRVKMLWKNIEARILSAAVCQDESVYGECDESQIWISKEKMNDIYLLGTMLHEALHYGCTFNGNWICEDDEHIIFRSLGDDC